MRDTYKSQE